MTDKPRSLIGFFLKTLFVVAVISATVLAGLNVWSHHTLKEARSHFEAVAIHDADTTKTCSRTQLMAAARTVSELILNSDEKKTIGDLALRPLEDWTAEDDVMVAEVSERNRQVMDTVALALTSRPPVDSEAPNEPTPGDRLTGSPIEIHLRLILAARVFAAEARLDIRNGDVNLATDKLIPLKNLAEGLESQGHFLDVMIGAAIERILDRCLLEAVSRASPVFTDDQTRFASLVPEVDLMMTLRTALTAEYSGWVEGWNETEINGALPGALVGPVTGPILKRLFQAALLDTGTHTMELINTPFGSSPETFRSPPEPPRWRIIRTAIGIAQPNMLNMIVRCQIAISLRQLIEASTTMRSQSWPANTYPKVRPALPSLTEPDPFSGQPLEYRLLEDGRLLLGISNGPELLEVLGLPGTQNQMNPIVLAVP